ncbi:MAG TPA: methyltransferase domain-containing protein [Anaerolineales bacterium]|nr:methyltransferase domain-containing protein [Anaerolineales bacterium]
MTNQKYVPALSFRWLTPLYDALIEGPMSIARMRRELLAQMGDLSNKKILDVGSGTGTMLAIIKQAHPSAEVVGLDGDPQILEIARAKARELGVEIRFDQGMSFDLPYPNESFEVVLTSMMLHHLTRDDKQTTAQEMYRVLRPGGQLFGADFGEPRSSFGKAIRPLTRRFERVAENVDGFLPVMFSQAGFKNYTETGRYFFGSIAVFQGSKS